MIQAGAAVASEKFAEQARGFVRDFAAYAGGDGVAAALLAVVAATSESIGLILLVPLISIVTTGNDSAGRFHDAALRMLTSAGAQTRTAQLSLLLGVFAALLVLRALVVARRDTTLARLQMGYVEQIRSCVARRLAGASWPVVSRLQHARVTNLVSGDIQRIGGAANCLVQFLVALLVSAMQASVAFLLAPALTAMALTLVVVGVVASFFMLGRAHRLGTQLSRTGIALTHETAQFLGGLKLAAGQNRQSAFVSEFEVSLTALKVQQLAFMRQQALSRLAATVISGLIGALIAFVGLTALDTPPAVLITALLIFARISAPAMQTSQLMQQFANALPAYAEVRRLEIELTIHETPNPDPKACPVTPGPIIFRNVSFSYPQTARSAGPITELNLTIAPGSRVGVSGPSGAGKTTFADLLVGLLEPEEGEISIGDALLRGAAAVNWRDQVSYVAQDPYLFRDTIRRNLLWANPRANEAELWDALVIAGADALVRDMPSGLDTLLGERGSLVSGGERQRLCLARAVLRRPWLYVFDEATSAIDMPAERVILRRIYELSPRPTIVMIAHRPESLAGCDCILRFEGGRIVVGE